MKIKAIIWYLVFWGLGEISLWRDPSLLEGEGFSHGLALFAFLGFFLIPFFLYLKSDLED